MGPELKQQDERKIQQERAVLDRFALRWAVLAAWRDELVRRGVKIEAEAKLKLDSARVKIISGCFSSCAVGCDLSAAEAALVSADSSRADGTVEFWMDLLGRSMAQNPDVELLLRVPSVKCHFTDCGQACRCTS